MAKSWLTSCKCQETRVPAQNNLPNPKLMATFSHALVPMKHDPYVIMNQAPITQLNTCQQIPHCNSFIRGDIMINNNIMLHHILANFYVRFFKWLAFGKPPPFPLVLCCDKKKVYTPEYAQATSWRADRHDAWCVYSAVFKCQHCTSGNSLSIDVDKGWFVT